ncbi:hypothetical protein [Bacillus toyonensis]|uniref:hypothetical protein n=1 Tax=Bacillus toyonensis TaxID=155322 RepID=UPI000BF1E656|nr:hypothetical protein [Bacillus toyonensis]PEN67170.1 hypothetical protein CN545_18890 [Bacillus toyonensis]
MDINLFDETVLKSIPALVTLAGMLASILVAGYKLFFRVKTTTEIDRLFLDKETIERINFGNFVIAFLSLICLYVTMALYFYYLCYDHLLHEHKELGKQILSWSTLIFLISIICLSIIFMLLRILKKLKWTTNIMKYLLFMSMLSGLFVYVFLFSELVFHTYNLENLIIGIVITVVPCFYYTLVMFKVNNRPTSHYSFVVINEEDIKKEKKLIHGYAIDEKRTICFINDQPHDSLFYICDFSAGVYIKYKKNQTN